MKSHEWLYSLPLPLVLFSLSAGAGPVKTHCRIVFCAVLVRAG
jgi:hypothetical protein